MASPLSDSLDLVARFEESARRGDWRTARGIAAILPQQALPASQEDLRECLRRMKEALIVARISRAHAAATLARVHTAAARLKAAAHFNNMRQEFGEAADS